MKTLDKYLLKLYAGPFLVTFMISVFILIMQFLWLYIDDLLGKGVEIRLVLELVMYWSSIILPLAMPLTILLSSIMTFGNLGESLELTAAKSSGISIINFGRSLFYLNLTIAILMFLFQNFVAPNFNLNALALLHDISNKKPAFNLVPNIFYNELEGYSIKIGSKDKDQNLYDIMIYDQTDHQGLNKYIYAKRGKMTYDDDKNLLLFELFDGYRLEEKNQSFMDEYESNQANFKFWNLSFDQSQLDLKRIDKELFLNNPSLMNNKQLTEYIKRCDTNIASRESSMEETVTQQMNFHQNLPVYQNRGGVPFPDEIETLNEEVNTTNRPDTLLGIKEAIQRNDFVNKESIAYDTPVAKANNFPLRKSGYSPFMKSLTTSELRESAPIARSKSRSVESSIEINYSNLNIYRQQKIDAKIEWHRKIAVSVACLLLFIIGASLGAIIRKGGLGLPIIFAVVLFIFYYIIMAFGEKFAKQGKLPPVIGEWFASLILAPIAIWLLIKVLNDSPIVNRDMYVNLWRAVQRKIRPNEIDTAK